ncbi:MAG: CPBP family intramembrane metalloprotease, partial [Prevotella sp.]|jgi:membrane protease YdiL (CAAX protease family)|nr:CPBP family intramembrane metalloprotease [Prevotella sp.]
MSARKIFMEMSSWSQLFFLWLFFVIGLIVAGVLSVVVAFFFIEGNAMPDIASLLAESTDYLRISQFIQQVFLFFVPACLCAFLFHRSTANYLKTNKFPSFILLLAGIILILVIQPLISYTGYYNEQMVLPEWMSGIEAWMKDTERNAEMLTKQLLAGSSLKVLLLNLFVMAVAAAVVEEFFFRGVLQQIIQKITRNYHWAVWLVALIFSAVHLQFYGFVPRLLLGALLGYLFVFSGSLWLPVLVHFINNAAGVLLYYFYHDTPQYETIESLGAADIQWTALPSLALTAALLYFLSRDYLHRHKNEYF